MKFRDFLIWGIASLVVVVISTLTGIKIWPSLTESEIFTHAPKACVHFAKGRAGDPDSISAVENILPVVSITKKQDWVMVTMKVRGRNIMNALVVTNVMCDMKFKNGKFYLNNLKELHSNE